MSQETPTPFHPPQNMTRPMGPLLIGERTEHVPEWCPWRYVTESAWRGDQEAQRKLLSTHVWTGPDEARAEFVLSCGKPITVAQVLPERRFAIEIDGKLKDQNDFNRDLELKFAETYAIAGERMAGDPAVIPKPDVREFVSWGEDPSNRRKRQRINFDPFAPAPKDVKPRTEEEARTDPVAGPAPGLRPAPKGVVHAGDDDGEVQASDAGRRGPGEEAQAPKVSENASVLPAPTLAEPSSPAPSVTATARCGKAFDKATDWQAKSAVRMHEGRCKKCRQEE